MMKTYEKPVITRCAKLEKITSLGRGGPVVVSGIVLKGDPRVE